MTPIKAVSPIITSATIVKSVMYSNIQTKPPLSC
jgi:hypothetical protein